MAAEQITFSIGSNFNGDGFNKANNAVKATGKFANAAKGVFTEVISQIQSTDGEVGKLVGQFSQLANIAGQLGVAGAAMYGVQQGAQALGDYIAHMNDDLLHAVEHANDLSERLKKIADTKVIALMKGALEEATTQGNALMASIKDSADALNALAGAKSESAVARMNEQIADMIKEKAQAVAGALGEFEKQLAGANADIKIAQAELEAAHAQAASAVEKAGRDVETATQRQLQAIDNVVSAQRAVELAENEYKKAMLHGNVSLAEYQRDVKASRAALLAAEKAKEKADNDLAVAIEKQETATSNMNAKMSQAETKIIQLTASRDELISKHNEQELAEDSLSISTKQLADARDEIAKDSIKRAKEEAKSKTKDLQDKIDAAEDRKKMLRDNSEMMDKANAAYNKHHGWMGGDTKWDRTKDGGISDFDDFIKAKRWADRAERDEAGNKLYNEGLRRKADDIQKRMDKGDYVSDSDKKWLKNYNDWQDQLDSSDSLDAQIADWKNEQLQIADQTKAYIEEIVTQLQDAGLK